MRATTAAFATTVLIISMGCVLKTQHQIDMHITLDIRHIETEADDILGYIEGETDTPPGDDARVRPGWLLRALSPMRVAYAEEVKLKNTSSSLKKKLIEQIKERLPKIDALKKRAIVGEDNRGYVDLRSSEDLSPEEKNEVQKIVHEENTDRKGLYKEIARLEKDERITLSIVERVFAKAHLKRAKPGELFQLPAKGERFDEFQESKLGEKLGDDCKPEAWVEIP